MAAAMTRRRAEGEQSWREHLTDDERRWLAEDDALLARIQKMRSDAVKYRRQKIVNRAVHRARAARMLAAKQEQTDA